MPIMILISNITKKNAASDIEAVKVPLPNYTLFMFIRAQKIIWV